MLEFLLMIVFAFGAVLLGSGVLHLLPRLGPPGRGLSGWFCRGIGLDLMITHFTVMPMFVGLYIASIAGLIGAIIGQAAGMLVWINLHEMSNREACEGARIVKTLNKSVGAWRNHLALWITALAVPLFWFVRLAEWVVYPPLTWTVRLPPYKSSEWVNVSRHKFEGLVGHDLIWCLYCDWMTGVWSLGTEMLRNVESFWCPIRFYDGKKCENCTLDFPDVGGGWVPADGTMEDVTKVLETQHAQGDHSWFGHPGRVDSGEVTVEGERQEHDATPSPQPQETKPGVDTAEDMGASDNKTTDV